MSFTELSNFTVSLDEVVAPIKLMNAVNNGPSKPRKDQTRGNFDDYKALRVPYARTHDANWCAAYGAPHTCDMSAIFPDFDADENDPASYDFVLTDDYLQTIQDAGTKVFFRLGQSIEHAKKKYFIGDPKDHGKWARICEHIIRHYTEGWADGFKWDIEYWEIYNEPDLGAHLYGDDCMNHLDDPPAYSPTWTGTPNQFFDLFATTATHLKKCFPHLKIGGPAACNPNNWCCIFLEYMRDHNVPMDFFSWHRYTVSPKMLADLCVMVREWLDKSGYTETESILNEWNYVKGWTDQWVYSLSVESGLNNMKGAAFTAAALTLCQDAPLDMLMYYDARINTVMNGLFDSITMEPLKAYYALYSWSKLLELGTEVKVDSAMVHNEWLNDGDDLAAVAATSKDGKSGGFFITRYNEDNNITHKRKVNIAFKGGAAPTAVRCHLTDNSRSHTEIRVEINEEGYLTLNLAPNSFALIEW